MSTSQNRGEVENFIKDLENTCKSEPPPAGGSPSGGATGGGEGGTNERTGSTGSNGGNPAGAGAGQVTRPGPTGAREGDAGEAGGAGDDSASDTEADGEGDADVEDSVTSEPERPHLLALHAAVGPSFPSMGDLEVGTLVSLSVGIGHPFYMGSVVFEPGVLVTYTPVPWEVAQEVAQEDTKGTAGLTGLMANGGLGFALLPRLSVRADVGIGMLIFSGLTVNGNPFLDSNQTADGPIPLFHARGALGVEYAVSKNFVVQAQPLVVSISPSPQLRTDIDSIRRFEMLVGAGLRM